MAYENGVQAAHHDRSELEHVTLSEPVQGTYCAHILQNIPKMHAVTLFAKLVKNHVPIVDFVVLAF